MATEYGDHRNALFGKLSDLLRERYEFHAKKWLSSPHPEAKAPPPLGGLCRPLAGRPAAGVPF